MHSSDTKTPSLMRVATRWLAAVHNTRLLHLNVKPLIKFRQRGNPIEADHCGDVDGKHICGDDFEFYEALVDSIRRHGVKEPVHLTAWGGKPHLADGHHRLNAAWEAGTKTIPAEVDSRLTDDWLLQQGLIDKRTASVSLGDRMFAIDNQLPTEAANWNHNLAHALKTMDRLSARPEKLTRLMKTFDAAFWLNRNPKALAEIKTLDPRLARDIVRFLQRGHRTAASDWTHGVSRKPSTRSNPSSKEVPRTTGPTKPWTTTPTTSTSPCSPSWGRRAKSSSNTT